MLWRQLAASDKWVWRREVFPSSATPLRQVACDAKRIRLPTVTTFLVVDTLIGCSECWPEKKNKNTRIFLFCWGDSKEQQISPMHHRLFLRDTNVIQTLSLTLSLHLPSVMNDKGAEDAISLPAYCYNRSLTYCVIKATIGGLRNRMKMMKDIFASDIGHLKWGSLEAISFHHARCYSLRSLREKSKRGSLWIGVTAKLAACHPPKSRY
ncbi:hypothetical protein CEXT_455901 [Caerostris extrusa]|uniref:Uncharacterized protein n=1 Tax=Caerostris extrusa TaxID=172846 RepID=A0AAV4RI82_CAEEX|nr:hypothetical protein CEXT_455901 [Caerostris extrusa]